MATTPTNFLDAINQLIVGIQQQRQVTYAQTAALSWIGWDIILTFPQEVRVVWRGKWSIAKTLYIIARYYPVIHLIISICVSTNTKVSSVGLYGCNHFFRFYASGTPTTYFVTDALLCIRVYALYNKSKKILILLILLYMMEVATATAFTVLTMSEVYAIPRPPGVPFPGCLSNPPPDTDRFISTWIIALIVQLTLFILTLNKYILSIQKFQVDDTGAIVYGKGNSVSMLQHAWKTRRVAPLLSLFVRDGTFAFFMVFAVVLMNILFIGVMSNGPFAQMGTSWLLSVCAVMISRLFLNLGGFLHSSPQLRMSECVVDTGTPRDANGPSMAQTLSTVRFGGGLSTQIRTSDGSIDDSEQPEISAVTDKGKGRERTHDWHVAETV